MCPSGRGTVLVVDDDEELRTSIGRRLRRDGFEVRLAANAAEGLVHLEAAPDVAVIVSDLRMPGMDGVDFLARARDVARGARSILMTAHADILVAQRAVNEARVRSFVTKPFEFEDLARQIRALLAERDAEIARWRSLATTLSLARP